MKGVPNSPVLRVGLLVPLLAAVVVLLWWRGPDWNVVYHAFDLVNWTWVASRSVSTSSRCCCARSPGG